MSTQTIKNNPFLEGSKVNKRAETIDDGRKKRRSVAGNFRKAARDKRLNDKRRIPLANIQDNSPQTQLKAKNAESRLEKLKRWKEERQREKNTLRAKSKKEFVVKHVVHSPAHFLLGKGLNGRRSSPRNKNPLSEKTKKKVLPQVSRQEPDKNKSSVHSSSMFTILVPKYESPVNEDKMSKTKPDIPVLEPLNTSVDEVKSVKEQQEEKVFSSLTTVIGNLNFISEVHEKDPIAAFNNTLSEEQQRTSFISVEVNTPVKTENEDESCGHRFRAIVKQESEKLINLCVEWEDILESETDIPDNAQGDIRSTIGQAKLLMDQRFNQFSGLIDLHETKSGEHEARSSDLDGFWGMIYYQVEDVHKKFENLALLKKRNWEEEKIVKRKQGKRNKVKSTSAVTNAKSQRKDNLRKFKAAMKAKMNANTNDETNMGFMTVLTPMKVKKTDDSEENTTQSIILTSVRRSTRKRKSVVPEMDFSSAGPTYLLPASVFEDCLKSSTSEWPVAVVNRTDTNDDTNDNINDDKINHDLSSEKLLRPHTTVLSPAETLLPDRVLTRSAKKRIDHVKRVVFSEDNALVSAPDELPANFGVAILPTTSPADRKLGIQNLDSLFESCASPGVQNTPGFARYLCPSISDDKTPAASRIDAGYANTPSRGTRSRKSVNDLMVFSP